MSMPPLIKKPTIVLDSLPEDEAELAALKEKLRNGAFLYIKGGTGGGSGNFPIATPDSPGAVQPDGITTTVDSTGLLSAIGGNLQLNSEEWITESGTWTAPVTGWFHVLTIGGGNGGYARAATDSGHARGGDSGAYDFGYAFLQAGQSYPVTIGAAGIGVIGVADNSAVRTGGITTFAPDHFHSTLAALGQNYKTKFSGAGSDAPSRTSRAFQVGAGFGGGVERNDATFFGGGGAGMSTSAETTVSNGAQGAVYLCWHDPAKANGPAASTFALSRNAVRAVKPATVNLYDPETGQGSVWREEDAPAQLAKGLITQEAWQAICAQKAAEAHAAWLADPDTEAERIEMLRAACEQKLSQTDKFTVPDYPITDEQRQAILAYRQAIRDLNHESGAPWDGGGELTPWPEMPELNSSDETE